MQKYRTKIILTNTFGEVYTVKSFTSCKVDKNITNATSSFNFSVDTFNLDYLSDNFGIGTEVNIYQGEEDNLIHTICGWVNQEPRKLEGMIKSIEYSGVDYTGKLQYVLVDEVYLDKDIGEIVSHLMTKYAPEYKTEIYTTGFKVSIKYNKAFLFDCLKELATIVDFNSFIDTNKIYKFMPIGAISEGRTIKTGQFKKGSGQFTRDASKLVNRLHVAGGLIPSKPTFEKFNYDVNMNKYLATKFKPKGVFRVSQFVDGKTEYAWKRTNGWKDLTGKHTVTANTVNAITNAIPYPEDLEELTIEWKGILTGKTGSLGSAYDLFRECRPDGFYNARGFGLYNHVGAIKFYVFYGAGSNDYVEIKVNENDIPFNKEISIQARWFGKTLEMYIDGELRASKEHTEKFDLYVDDTRLTSYASFQGTFQYQCQGVATPNEVRLSWVSRSENEMKPFIDSKLETERVWVYKNGLQLRAGIDNLNDDKKYDVVYSYNEKTFTFGEDFILNNGDVIDVYYCYEYPIMDILENKPSQQRYGVFEDKLVINNNLRDYVKAQAHKHLQKYSKPVVTGSLEPFNLTYQVGELVNVVIPELKIDEANVQITQVSYSSSPSMVSCSIALETETNVSQLFANIIKRVENLEIEQFYGEEEEVQQLEKFVEDFTPIETYQITQKTASDFVFDGCRWNFSEFN